MIATYEDDNCESMGRQDWFGAMNCFHQLISQRLSGNYGHLFYLSLSYNNLSSLCVTAKYCNLGFLSYCSSLCGSIRKKEHLDITQGGLKPNSLTYNFVEVSGHNL